MAHRGVVHESLAETLPACAARTGLPAEGSVEVCVARLALREEYVMAPLLIGYARVSTDEQDVTAQREALAALGVSAERIYVDHGLTGTNRDRPGLREATGCMPRRRHARPYQARPARTLTARRSRDPRDLTRRHVKLSLGGSLHDPNDPVGRLLFNVLAMVAEFEADLIRLRTREGMRVAKAKGHLRGKQPKLNPRQEAHLVALHRAGEHSTAELGDLFGVARSTVYRAIQRDQRSQKTFVERHESITPQLR